MGRLSRLALLCLVCASAAQARPQRVVSINLCSDEYLLLLADRAQILSVSHLGADPLETPLAARAKGIIVNHGRLNDVVRYKPDLLITGGYSEPFSQALAQHMGINTLDLPAPQSPQDVRRNIRALAHRLDQVARGEAIIARYDQLLAYKPTRLRRAALVEGGGYTVPADGLAATYLRAAGLAQISAGTRLRYEALLRHPALEKLHDRARFLDIDGRSWTCLGPLAAEAIPALRKALQP